MARALLLGLPGIEEGRSYGLPSFKLGGRFFARFRDRDEVLVVTLGSMADREVLMQLDPEAFFFTEHYRNYPTVLIRLAAVRRGLLEDVLRSAWRQATERGPKSRRPRKAGGTAGKRRRRPE